MAKKVGTVDEDGVLWKATKVGNLTVGYGSFKNLWETLAASAKVNLEKKCAGQRPITSRQQVDGFEKYTLGPYEWMTYGQYFSEVENFASGLVSAIPFSHGDTLIIYADTQCAWMQAAYAAWRQGLVVGTIYATLGEEGALYGINQSKAKAVVADGKLLNVLSKICKSFTHLKDVIAISEPDAASGEALTSAGIKVHLMADLKKAGAEKPRAADPAAPTETCVLMYTSGTTGNPKGVLLTHQAVLSVVASTCGDGSAVTFNGKKFIRPTSVYLAYLPLAHIMELAVEITMFALGVTVGYGTTGTLTPSGVKMVQDPPQIGDAGALSPTLFVAAPAVLDKVYVGALKKMADLSPFLKKRALAGLESGKARFAKGKYGASGIIANIIFKKFKKALGGKVEIMLTGSAPLSLDVQIFMQSVFGCPVRQGYGLTETCAATCITCGEDQSPSVVGPPQESACIRLRDWEEGNYLAKDLNGPIGMRRGEVLIGGPTIATGYLVDEANPDPEIVAKNNEDFTTIGGIRYFCTGDIGQFTPAGNLQIIDRKKDLVKLQQGEYVALSKVENVLKACQYTALPMVYAQSTKSYCIVLLCPAVHKLKELATSLGVEGDLSAMCANPKVTAAVLEAVTATCKAAKLVRFEMPTKVILIDDLWTPENDMLTAVNKLKRKQIVEKHQALIDEVYV
jgi:long-subunit acyl-CoA synthetase (AMP-forming)